MDRGNEVSKILYFITLRLIGRTGNKQLSILAGCAVKVSKIWPAKLTNHNAYTN